MVGGLVGVVLGAFATAVLTMVGWRRQTRLRWDEERLETYLSFQSAMQRCALYLSYSKLDDRMQRGNTDSDLEQFRIARDEMSIVLGRIRLAAGPPEVTASAIACWDALVNWRAIRDRPDVAIGSTEWEERYGNFSKARDSFLEAVRQELKIGQRASRERKHQRVRHRAAGRTARIT